MAKSISSASGFKERKTRVMAKPERRQKLSKAEEWWLAHPKGIEATYIDWKAVLK